MRGHSKIQSFPAPKNKKQQCAAVLAFFFTPTNKRNHPPTTDPSSQYPHTVRNYMMEGSTDDGTSPLILLWHNRRAARRAVETAVRRTKETAPLANTFCSQDRVLFLTSLSKKVDFGTQQRKSGKSSGQQRQSDRIVRASTVRRRRPSRRVVPSTEYRGNHGESIIIYQYFLQLQSRRHMGMFKKNVATVK
jgi:hypothetical protein